MGVGRRLRRKLVTLASVWLAMPCAGSGLSYRLRRNGAFGKLVIGNVLRGRRAYPAGGPTRAAVRNPGGAPDNTKCFPP